MKTLGILETDVLYDDLIDDYQSYGHLFKTLFERQNCRLTIRFYHVQQNQWPTDFSECDAWLITGSKAGVYDDFPWIQQLQTWIKHAFEHQQRLIGVCFGHQMLAHSLGGHAAKHENGWGIGVHTTEIEHLPLWLNDNEHHLRLIYSHQDQVKTLPPKARRLARGEFCPNAAFYIDQRVLSFQGHPEFTPVYLERLLQRRAEAIGEPTYS